MKLTREIAKALQECIEEGFESVSEFAKFANVSTDTVSKYLQCETESIKADTWRRIQPLLKLKSQKAETHHKPLELSSDEKIRAEPSRSSIGCETSNAVEPRNPMEQ